MTRGGSNVHWWVARYRDSGLAGWREYSYGGSVEDTQTSARMVAGLHRAGRRILSRVLARVRKWFDGAGWFVGAAVVLLVFALLAMLAGLQSRDSLLWTGQQVTGTEQQGLVYYRWQGQSYSLAVPGSGSSKAVSVYFNPGDPSQAVTDNVLDRVLAGLLVLGPAAGAVVLLVIGGTRNYRWQRRKLKRAREFTL